MRTHLGLRGLLFHGSGYQVAVVYRLSLGQAVWHHGMSMAQGAMISATEATGQHWENAPAWNLACSWRNVRKYRTSRMRDRLGNRKQVGK